MTTQYEYYNAGDNQYVQAYGALWQAQTFTVGAVGHSITSVKLKLARYGSPGTVTIGIRATDGSGHPTGGDLTSGTIDGNSLTTNLAGAWYEIALTELTLVANTKYAIVVRAPSAGDPNCVFWRMNRGSPTYSGGLEEESTNSGGSWTAHSDEDCMFEVWGNALVTAPTVTTQAATNLGLD
jgi:hypothetical protein